MATTTGATINSTSGVVTWVNNTSTSKKTSGTISVTVTGLGSKSKTATATCSQNAGSQVWGNPSITTFAYGTVSAAGGSQNPSLVYTQSYTWNGVSGSGGSVNGNGDDDYSNYAVKTNATGLTLNTTSGAVTWAANKGTTGKLDAAARSGVITVTVTRNGKTATKDATTSQSGEAVSRTDYGTWTFSITPNTTSIAATGGSATFTLSRPTRTNTVHLTSGDSYTTTETATSGTFALTRSNTSFTLSATSISMTSSSLPTFTLSVAGTGATTASAISSTVTAAFTASNPTTGTTTASKTSSSVTRAASTLSSTAYKFSTFSLNKSSFTAASGTATLSMVVQRQRTFTGGTESWNTITPSSGTLSVTSGTGGTVGTITYGSTSTCTITVAANTSTSSRSITLTGKYNGSAITGNTATISQSADAVSSTSYGNVTAGKITNATIPASGTTTNYTATAGNGSQVITYTWVSGNSTTETKSIAPSVASISATAGSKGTTESEITTVKSQAVTWTGSGNKSASGTMYIYQQANTKGSAQYSTTIDSFSYPEKDYTTGSVSPSLSVSQTTTYQYTSGSETSAASNYWSPSYSITDTSAGVVLESSSTGELTWAENTGSSDRSVNVTVTVNNGSQGSVSKTTTAVQKYNEVIAYTLAEMQAHEGYYLFSTNDSLFYAYDSALSADNGNFLPILWVNISPFNTQIGIFGICVAYYTSDMWGTLNVDTDLPNSTYDSAANSLFQGHSIEAANRVASLGISDAVAINHAISFGETVMYEFADVLGLPVIVQGFLPSAREIEWVCTHIGDKVDTLRGVFSNTTYTGSEQWTCLEYNANYALGCLPTATEAVIKDGYLEITPYVHLDVLE